MATKSTRIVLDVDESGDFRDGPCVPRFKFALRGAFASTADQSQTDQRRCRSKTIGLKILWQPLCGFVFKMQFSGNVLFEIIIFEVRKMIKFESTLLSRVGQSLTL